LDSIIFLGADNSLTDPEVVLLGVPYDGTASFRPGARFGPSAVRIWSDVLETYSPLFKRDLEDVKLLDAGDLPFHAAVWQEVSDAVCDAVSGTLSRGGRTVLIGGEHTITLPAVESYMKYYNDLAVIQMDAHLDLRDEYAGLRFSHATVMRRVLEKVGTGGLFQYGVRSGTRDEWAFVEGGNTLIKDPCTLGAILGERPVYLTIDLDVLDPSVMPETGTPEPGGISFTELNDTVLALRELNVVGGDVVEYSPLPGGGGPSGAVAAKVIRELILLIAENG
jgi:agmatinase